MCVLGDKRCWENFGRNDACRDDDRHYVRNDDIDG